MRSPDTFLALGIVVLLFLAVSLGSVPLVSAEDYPLGSDTRIIRTTLWKDKWNIICTYLGSASQRSGAVGQLFGIVETTVNVSKDYATTAEQALANTRASAIVTSPDGTVIFDGLLTDTLHYPNDVLENRWEFDYYKEFPIHTLTEGTYTIAITYEVWTGTSWELADSRVYCLTCEVGPDYPIGSDTRIIRTSLWRDRWNIICTYLGNSGDRAHDAGFLLSIVETTVQVSKDYAVTAEQAVAYTRVYATITSPSATVVFEGLLGEISWAPNDVLVNRWELVYYASFIPHVLQEGVYVIDVTYEVLIGTTWTLADSSVYFLTCGAPGETPDVSPEDLGVVWLPLMMSVAVIVGMAFIGFNLSKRSHDPMPGLFMGFTGIILAWAVGWLDTWILLTALALIAILGASLWLKPFRGQGK